MRNTFLLSAVAFYTVACATAPVPAVVPAAAASPKVSAQLDADAYRAELEAAYAHVLSRAESEKTKTIPVDAPVVDLEAAASIPMPEHRTIDSAVRLFSEDMKDSIQTSLTRSARYKNLIDKALSDQKLPKGLAYLPVIESAYLPKLTSRVGAHGIWQFMPETAREYGLRVDWWVDERADPERSTRAAAQYLGDLYRMFDDWGLALAAYNCGPGRVKRTMQDAGATTFWELLDAGLLPKETRGYVPTFFATLRIASDPATYGFELGKSSGDLDEKRVDVKGPVSLTYIAEVIGVDADVLADMNPSLRRGVVPPGRSSVRVPAKKADDLIARADSLRDDDAYVKYCAFRLRDGDTIKKLARRIGAKPETLLAMNNLDENDRIGAGDSIYLPVRAGELATLLSKQNDEIFYAVRKGDTLYSIAKKNGLSVAELREINELSKKSTIHVGMKLRVAAPRTLSAGGM